MLANRKNQANAASKRNEPTAPGRHTLSELMSISTRKQKRLNRLGYGGGKRFKTMSDLNNSFSDPDNDSDLNNPDPGASLNTE